jgi:anti-anti-sigma factor
MSLSRPPAEVRLAGELDISRKQELRDALRSAAGGAAVLLDLSGVTWADSTALAELLRFCTDLERRDVPVALVVVAPQFNRVIEYAGLRATFHVFDRRDDALGYLERPSR